MTEILDAMTKPDSNGTPALPKRSGPNGMLPSTWLSRTLRLEYIDGFGAGVETSGSTSTQPARSCMWREPGGCFAGSGSSGASWSRTEGGGGIGYGTL
jgi:hypothetical protein